MPLPRTNYLLSACMLLLADFNAPWRPFTVLDASTGRLMGPWMTKLDKLLSGLRWWCSHVQEKGTVEEWLQQLCYNIQVGDIGRVCARRDQLGVTGGGGQGKGGIFKGVAYMVRLSREDY